MLGSFSRLSLLWKILLATSIALTLLFALVGWIVEDNATRAMSASVDEDVQASFRAYDSLWRSRAQTLAAVSLVISRMSDVRAAFSTGDQATIRDSADELWKQISNQDAIFLVTDPEGRVLASLGGNLGEALKHDVPAVRDAAASFPKQTSGFVTLSGHLYQIAVTPVYVQSGAGMGLLNVLVAGYEVNQETVRSLKDSTGGSEFCFLSGSSVVASTLDPSANARMPGRLSAGWSRGAHRSRRDALHHARNSLAGRSGTAHRRASNFAIVRERAAADRCSGPRYHRRVADRRAGGIVAYLQPRPAHPAARKRTGSRSERSRARQLRLPHTGGRSGRWHARRTRAPGRGIQRHVRFYPGRAPGIDPPGTDRHYRPALDFHRA